MDLLRAPWHSGRRSPVVRYLPWALADRRELESATLRVRPAPADPWTSRQIILSRPLVRQLPEKAFECGRPYAVNTVSKKCVCGLSAPSMGLPEWPAREAKWCKHCPSRPDYAVNIVKRKSRKGECGAGHPTHSPPAAAPFAAYPGRPVDAHPMVAMPPRAWSAGNMAPGWRTLGEASSGDKPEDSWQPTDILFLGP
eukprot:jgi/Tetstr1/431901/TSEL_021390.t1